MFKRNIKKMVVVGLFFFSCIYLLLMFICVFILDTDRRVGILPNSERIKFFWPRIPLYFLIFFLFITFFIVCLWNIKKKTAYIGVVLVSFMILACIRYDLPLFPRNMCAWRKVWQNDVVEYLFPLAYLGMLISLLLLPALYDLLAKIQNGKRILIAFMAFEALSIDFVSVISSIVMEIESPHYSMINLFGTMMLVKTGILFCTYKLMLNKEDLQVEMGERNCCRSILVWLVPICVMLLFLIVNVEHKGNHILIPRQAEIDGYWYFGNVEHFIEQYENPYWDRRVYLEVGAAQEEYTEEEKETVDWNYSDEQNLLMIVTYERKLEGFYYLEQYSEAECESSNLHSFELKKRQKIDCGLNLDGKENRNYRAVLSEEVYENTAFTYCIEEELKYIPTYLFEPNGFGIRYGSKIQRDIEEYDILVQGKEIPAYFLGMVDTYGFVKVEPYTHFWGENYYERWQNTLVKLQAARQY